MKWDSKAAGPTPDAGCTGKVAYDDWHTAKLMAQRTRRQKETTVEPYKCRHCHKFHVGAARRKPKKMKEIA